MSERVVTGRHVLFGVLAFFAVVLAANGTFIFLALDTWTGLSTENPYQRGIEYNDVLDAAARQRALGWTGVVSFVPSRDGRGRLSLIVTDRRGAPVENLTVTADIRRPTNEGFDQAVALAPSGAGTYVVELELPLPGQWDVHALGEARDGRRFEIEDRIWLN